MIDKDEFFRTYTDLRWIIEGEPVSSFIHQTFGKKIQDFNILEAGCGSAKASINLALNDAKTVVAFDIDPNVVYHARKLITISSLITGVAPFIGVYQGDIHNIQQPDNTFDLVFSEGVHEHWHSDLERQKPFDECTRVSKKYVIIIVPWVDHPDSQKIAETTIHTYKSMPEKELPFTIVELSTRMYRSGLKTVKIEQFKHIPRFIIGIGEK